MAKNCSACGSPLKDGAKFCEVCGAPVAVKRIEQERFCAQCGNLLKPGTKFCEICGREVPQEKAKAEPQIKEPTTMDELEVPEITADTFASNKEINTSQKFDGFEEAVMPDKEEPKPQQPAPAPAFSMDSAPSPAAPKVAVSVKQPAQTQPQPNAYARPQQPDQYAQPQQANTYPQPGAPIPTVGADGKEKKNSLVVPIILIVLIVAVLVADCIIFLGHKKDTKDDSAEKSAAVVADIAEYSAQAEDFDILL